MSKRIHANLIPSALGSNGVASMVEPEPSSQNQSAWRARRSGKVSESKEGHGDTVDIEKNDVKNERPIAKQATWFSTVLENGRKLTLNVIVLVAVILGVAAIGKATIKRSVLIEPIGVPKELADRGFTGEAVAHHIVDELMILSKNAETLMQFNAVATSGAEIAKPKIELPGTGISIDTIVYYLRDLLSLSDTKISGEITIDSAKPDAPAQKDSQKPLPKFSLRLRILDKGFVYVEPDSTDDLRVLFKRAALPLLEQINPYIAGVIYLHLQDFIAATRMAEIALKSGTADDQEWASNLIGNIADYQKRRDVAIAEFKKLSQRFPDSPLGQYNLGHELYTVGRYQESIQASLDGQELIGLSNGEHSVTATPLRRLTKCEKRKSSSTCMTKTRVEYCEP
jgi:hypothetical protein